MLTRLEIRSFAVIDHAVFTPDTGLNVISGETGAGKSLLIDAIGLILGQKASRNLIRSDSDNAYIEAQFISDETSRRILRPVFEEAGIPEDEGNIIISRTVGRDGRSFARINGTGVILPVLRRISGELVDIHGQSDTSRIFDTSVHIKMLDTYGGDEIKNLLEAYREKLVEYRNLSSEYSRISKLASSSGARKDYLEYAVREIGEADLKPGEDIALAARKKEIASLARDSAVINEVRDLICGVDSFGRTPGSRLNDALRDLRKLSAGDPSFSEYTQRLESIILDFEAFSSDLDKKTSFSVYDPDEERRINERLGKIYELQSKYGKTIEDVKDFAKNASNELEEINEAGSRIIEIRKRMRDCEKELLARAAKLSDSRKKTAGEMSALITQDLKDLEMPASSFYVDFKTRPRDRFFNKDGIDDVVFMFSSNPGLPPQNLAQTASGGEASRIMLAIKNVLSSADTVSTLIFDEIDTGVSGRASLSIAKKLKSISEAHQILCVSHTAQLAAAADNNFLIEKNTDGVNTYTSITGLDEEQKIIEISRLLSGNTSEQSKTLARKMVEELGA